MHFPSAQPTQPSAKTLCAPRATPRGVRRRLMRFGVLLLALPMIGAVAFQMAVMCWPYPAGLGELPAPAAFIEDHNGVPLAAFVAQDGQWRIPLAARDISPHLLDAIVAVEDERFYEHSGVDWRAAAGAAWQDLRSRHIARGASTIAMQLQRLRDPRPRTFFNKFEQAVRGAQLERRTSRQQILVEYLNRSPFGGNLVGAGAASWRYFGRPCTNLSLGEAALLAGLPQAPNRYRPDRHPIEARRRRAHVLDRMLALGMIDRRQHDDAVAEPIAASWRALPQMRASDAPEADGAIAMLANIARRAPGARTRVTLDAAIQRQAMRMAREHLRRMETSGVSSAAVVVLDTQTASCLAAVSLGRAARQMDLTRRPRSTGSTLKPFIYAAAFEAGICTPRSVLDDSPVAWAGYAPSDYDRAFRGPISAAQALAQSRNIPAMLVLAKVGVEPAVGLMQAAGLRTLARATRPYGLSLAIGGAEATPLELAQAYAMLARGGTAREMRIIAARGPSAGAAAREPARCLSARACWEVLDSLADPDRTASVCPAAARLLPAWKTGTSSGHRDAWCAAVTPGFTVVVWLGNPNGQGAVSLVGAQAAAPLALHLIASLDKGPGLPWPAPPAIASEDHAREGRRLPDDTLELSMVSPAPGAQFLLDPQAPADSQRVLLKSAVRSADPLHANETLWWFVDNQPVAVGSASTQHWWPPTRGAHVVRVIDAQGHAAVARIVVR